MESPMKPNDEISPIRVSQIKKELQSRLAKGIYPPGSRLPLREELQKELHAGRVAIQEAIDHLLANGLVISRGRLGTFVAERPLFTYCYGIALPDELPRCMGLQFGTTFRESAHLLAARKKLEFRWFPSVPRGIESNDWLEKQPLAQALNDQLLAGVIYPVGGGNLWAVTLRETYPDVPSVRFGFAPTFEPDPNPNGAVLHFCWDAMVDAALEQLAKQGKTKVALFSSGTIYPKHKALWNDLCQKHGLHTHELWCATLPIGLHRVTETLLRLMWNSTAGQPDCCVVTDDSLMESLFTAFSRQGIRSPEDCAVVAHANFPLRESRSFPAGRVGYSSLEILETCVALIAAQRTGQPFERNTRMPLQQS